MMGGPGVLLLIKGLGRGGAEQLLVNAARHLDAGRFRYEVAYVLPWKDALVGDLEGAGIAVHCLEGGRGLAWIGRLRSLVRTRRIRLVHAHSPYPAIAARTALPRGVRHVATEHNVWQRYHPATYWANALTFPRNDHVFTVSDEVRRSVRYPAPLRFRRMPPVETLHHGLDPDEAVTPPDRAGVRSELGLPPASKVMGTVGTFTPKKAHSVLLEAARQVREHIPDLRVVLVGHGPLEGDLRRRTEELELGETVVFTGFREDARRVMTAFDVFTLSSAFEGLPIALLEAMANGIPAVVTSVGGNPEVVEDGRDGLLVPPGNPGALAGALMRVLSDPDLRRRLGEAGRSRAADFDIRRAVGRMQEVYGGLLS